MVGRASLLHPQLVEQREPLHVLLDVADPLGGEHDRTSVGLRDDGREIDDPAVRRRPCRRGLRALSGERSVDLTLQLAIALPSRAARPPRS
jgi:hypothetical protein